MGAIVYKLESRDFKEMQHALSTWDHRYRQISPGAFHGGLLHTQIGSLGIFRNRWERAVHYRGAALGQRGNGDPRDRAGTADRRPYPR